MLRREDSTLSGVLAGLVVAASAAHYSLMPSASPGPPVPATRAALPAPDRSATRQALANCVAASARCAEECERGGGDPVLLRAAEACRQAEEACRKALAGHER